MRLRPRQTRYSKLPAVAQSRSIAACAPARENNSKFSVVHDDIPPVSRVQSDPKTTIDMVMTLLPHETSSKPAPNEHEKRVLQAFRVGPDKLLTIPRDHSLPSPYSYFTTVNSDDSYISQPRLSVTKVLTKAWCELRTYYEVFSGSPRIAQSERMRSGSQYHLELEQAAHPTIDLALLQTQIAELESLLPEAKKRHFEQSLAAHNLCSSWMEQSVKRLLTLGRNNFAREMIVHGFLDMANERLVCEKENLKNGVLLNGVADIVALTAQYESHDDEVFLGDESSELEDLKVAIPKAKARVDAVAANKRLQITDIKTRERNSVPAQESVVDAAKLQCMYYGQFLDTLSRDAVYAYESCLENARRRGVDPDAPISEVHAISLLVAHFPLVAPDFLRLAQGTPISFDAFDTLQHSKESYSLKSVVSETKLRDILASHYGNSHLDLSPLFGEWKTPLTFRYMAARCGQAFNILESIQTSTVSVEYHNVKSRSVIARKEAVFDTQKLQASIRDTSEFWGGKRAPEATEDYSRCSYCDFKRRCPAVNGEEMREAKDVRRHQR